MLSLQRLHCRRVRRILWDYVAERLSEGPLEMVERHLADCQVCRREAASLRRAQSLLSAYRQAPLAPPRSDWNTLRARLLQTPLPYRPAYRESWRPQLALSGGLVVFLLSAAAGYHGLRLAVSPSHDHNRVSSFITPTSLPQKPPLEPYEPGVASNKAVHKPVAEPSQQNTDSDTQVAKSDANGMSWTPPERSLRPADGGRSPSRSTYVAETTPPRVKPVAPRPQFVANRDDASYKELAGVKKPDSSDTSPHFRPYKRQPGDGLSDTSEQPKFYSNNIRQVGDGEFVMPELSPDQHDDDSPDVR